MDEIFKNMTPDRILLIGIFLGLIWTVILDLSYSIIDYIHERAWNNTKYEILILKMYDPEYLFNNNKLTSEDISIYYKIKNKHEKRVKGLKKINNLFKRKKEKNDIK